MRAGAAAAGVLWLSLGSLTLAGALSLAAAEPGALVASYLRARDDGAVGEVAGQAQGDPKRPSAPPVPYEGVSVMLLPRLPDLEAELGEIKAHLRDSLKSYMEGTTDVTETRAAFERTLLAAGGGELIRGEVSDARGLLRFAEVPAGDWLLLAWRVEPHPGKPPKLRLEDTSAFREIPVSRGYATVAYWLMPVAVRPGETTAVDLNDRNVWLTGIREHLHVIEGTPRKKAGSSKHR